MQGHSGHDAVSLVFPPDRHGAKRSGSLARSNELGLIEAAHK